jgi:glucan phosphoethanolaminetransferase (alkaline phosphatase superfamily)
LSDHGESFSEHGEYTHGVFLYDSTMRIAFLMAGGGSPPVFV